MIRTMFLAAAIAVAMSGAAWAQTTEWSHDILPFKPTGPQHLIVSCGENRSVDVSLETGAVEIKGCEPNEAARVFWESVRQMFPPTAMKRGPNCTVYLSRVVVPALIDWPCAQEVAQGDGGDPLAKEFARALIAVRDHNYENHRH